MTYYPLDYFDSTVGILEQITLAVMALQKNNAQFQDEVIKGEFIANSMNWLTTNDFLSDGTQQCSLFLSMKFQIPSYLRNQLIRIQGTLDKRVASYVSANIDKLGLYREDSYEQCSLAPIFPSYLTIDNPENILERRLLYLVLQTIAIQKWIQDWNALAPNWQIRAYAPALADSVGIEQMEVLNDKRDVLLAMLDIGIPFGFYFPEPEIIESTESTEVPETAEAEANFLSIGDSGDAGNSGSSGSGVGNDYMSSSLLAKLNNPFGDDSAEPTTFTPSESPTLKDC